MNFSWSFSTQKYGQFIKVQNLKTNSHDSLLNGFGKTKKKNLSPK